MKKIRKLFALFAALVLLAGCSYDILQDPLKSAESKSQETFVTSEKQKTQKKITESNRMPIIWDRIPTIKIECEAEYLELEKNAYEEAVMTIEDGENTVYNDGIRIRLRGNTTSWQDKRPFRIKLDTKTELFGMEANRNWCLLANYFDRSHLRNKLSYDLSKTLGHFACDSVFVRLEFNGNYVGLYQLCETICIDSKRVNIFDWEEEAKQVAEKFAVYDGMSEQELEKFKIKLKKNLNWVTAGKLDGYRLSDCYDMSHYDITGGYLLENDSYYDEVSKFTTPGSMKIMVKSPEYIYTNDKMMSYIEGYILSVEEAVFAEDGKNGNGQHYAELIDMESFIDYWIVNQVFKNVEIQSKSTYMYKPTGDVLYFGPVWDMDWSSGNHVNVSATSAKTDSWKLADNDDREYWYRELYDDPFFLTALCERWAEIQPVLAKMLQELDKLETVLKDAADEDVKCWQYDTDFKEETDMLRSWLAKRISWINAQLENAETAMRSFAVTYAK